MTWWTQGLTPSMPKANSNNSSVALIIGLAFWWPFFRKYEYSALFTFYQKPAETMWSVYAPTMIGLVVALLVGIVLHKQFSRFIEGRRLATSLVCMTGSIGWALTLIAPFFGTGTQVMLALGCLMSAFGYAWLTLCWGCSICSLSSLHSAPAILLAFATSSLFQITAFLPTPIMIGIAIAAPALSGFAWLYYGMSSQAKTDNEIHEGLQSMPLGVIGMLGLFLLAGRLAVGLLAYATETVPDNDRLLTIICSLTLSSVMFVALQRVQDKGRLFQLIWSGLVVIFMAGMFSLLVENETLSHIATASLSAVLGGFEVELFVIVSVSSVMYGASGVLTFGLTVLLFRVLPNFLGKSLTPVLIGADPSWAQQMTAFVVPFMTFLAVVATIVFMNARTIGIISWFDSSANTTTAGTFGNTDSLIDLDKRSTQISSQTSLTPACKMLAAKFGLTARETDVLLLVSEGRSYQKIADTLGISLGTVQGHVKCLYRKLGVHTKQEVIELARKP